MFTFFFSRLFKSAVALYRWASVSTKRSSKLKIQLRDKLADKYYFSCKFLSAVRWFSGAVSPTLLQFHVWDSIGPSEMNSIVHMQLFCFRFFFSVSATALSLCHARGAQSKFTFEQKTFRFSNFSHWSIFYLQFIFTMIRCSLHIYRQVKWFSFKRPIWLSMPFEFHFNCLHLAFYYDPNSICLVIW